MLKSLELVGFKSFADRTRFEFAPGITAVVGPNGSGKSNVVDALKWVLGAQSAKSLRGQEMADVIFNGSGSRKPLNTAEVTLTFDNRKSLLPLDTKEVSITRRIYRSGEGEYLINRETSRLKYIRDLFRGTGAGSDAYSVIEQGRVDRLLSATAKERRELFEEAAGISRFKSKKLETLRRLERIDQNLVRLADIVEEVESQVRSLRTQAGKARRFREYSDRLRQLRTQVGFAEYRHLNDRLETLESDLGEEKVEVETFTKQALELEQEAQKLEETLDGLNQHLQQCQRVLSEDREKIATIETTIEHERNRSHDLSRDTTRYRQRIAAIEERLIDLRHQVQTAVTKEQSAREAFEQAKERLNNGETSQGLLTSQITTSEQSLSENQQRLRERARFAAQLTNDISSLESQAQAARETHARAEEQLAELETVRQELLARIEQLQRDEADRQRAAEREAERSRQLQARLQERREERSRLSSELSSAKSRHAATEERMALLVDLEKRREGVGAGVKQVLEAARNEPHGPFGEVKGIVAELFQVSVETAPLIEIALGESTQYLVVSSGRRLLAHLTHHPITWKGRVSFARLDVLDPEFDADVDLDGHRGVIGRADRFVETDDEFRPLLERLLGKIWIVETLEDAFELSSFTQVEFVTLNGESLKADGTISAGPQHSSMGLISRRSELRELRLQVEQSQTQIAELEIALAELDQRIEDDVERAKLQTERQQHAQESVNAVRQQVGTIEGRLGQVDQQREKWRAENKRAEEQSRNVTEGLQSARQQKQAAEEEVTELEQKILGDQQHLNESQARREAQSIEVTTAKIEVAKSEERLEGLQNHSQQLARELEERERSLEEVRTQLEECLQKADWSYWSILQGESELALLYLSKEKQALASYQYIEQREALALERSDLLRQAQHLRDQVRRQEDDLHSRDLKINELKLRRKNLLDRMREDYEIDLDNLEEAPTESDLVRRDEAEAEIELLRRKIAQLGNVNLDALEDLEDLEARFEKLSVQFKDLTESKLAIQRLINRIDQDSRQLFVDTLNEIRVHFQDLFRKLFGGGQADIVIEEGTDPLEGGIEMIARPPGKELRNVTLLSGGEKTMTCVALLLAIFRNRPSPFCVLDEVDAALDEANTDRFVKVLEEFLDVTQFIIISHSKKTMIAAHALYGVTMEESGISKRVSVQFEEMGEKDIDEFLPPPPQPEAEEDRPAA
ncbi:Hypothetical protein PBC10988_1690 [Planctomycetales bacterium 10988]|nr:Hypothetical protein PBC10988_1690 [Planctomycetales bacterium 10988]